MKSYISLTFIFLHLYTIMASQTGFQHYYIYDAGNNPDEKKYEFGKMAIENKKLVKSQSKMADTLWIHDVKKSIDQLSPSKNGLIVYIHGYQGDNKYFIQQSGYVIQNDIFDQKAHHYGMAISLQWKSVLPYDTAVKNAYEKGKNFVNHLDSIYIYLKAKHPEAPVTFITHSMGNRVWQGIFENWIILRPDVFINNSIMFAADLESNIFCNGFSGIEKSVGKVYIYHNLSDRTLQMANAMKPHQRLGIIGPDLPLPETLDTVLVVRNATEIKDDESFAGKLTFHRYYYGSPTIRKEIVDILSK